VAVAIAVLRALWRKKLRRYVLLGIILVGHGDMPPKMVV
jgi:hypothetical protein